MSNYKDVIVTDGTDQAKRQSIALQPDYINIEEHSFEQLLAFGSEIASEINFFNLQNKIDGNWGELFNADEAVIMAKIICTDQEKIESEFLTFLNCNRREAIFSIYQLIININFWYMRLNACQQEASTELARKIANLINKNLSLELHYLIMYVTQLEAESTLQSSSISNAETESKNDDVIPFDFSSLNAIWYTSDPIKLKLIEENTNDAVHKSSSSSRIRASFYVILNAISYLKSITPSFFSQSMKSQQHDPAIGLFMVFLQLHQKAQAKINTFSQRHLDFYYRKILKLENRSRVPENFHLLLKANNSTQAVFIKKDTNFSAGKDAKLKDIIYLANNNLLIKDATVQCLTTLNLQRDKLAFPESRLGLVTRIKSDVPVGLNKPSDEESRIAWPLFGSDTKSNKRQNSSDATLGFCIASPQFILREGIRTIDISLELVPLIRHNTDQLIDRIKQLGSGDENVFSKFKTCLGHLYSNALLIDRGAISEKQLQTLMNKAREIGAEISEEDLDLIFDKNQSDLFYKVFRNNFSLSFTSEQGWLHVVDYSILPYDYDEGREENKPSDSAAPGSKSGLRFKLTLGQQHDPIVPYDPEIHGDLIKTKLPIFRCCINERSRFYPYSLFNGLVVNSFKVDVDVKGLSQIISYNQHGQIDNAKPFLPFGPLPNNNSFFMFGNEEMARKKLSHLSLDFEWGELPRSIGGFSTHYKEYTTPFNNATFKVRATALSNNKWWPFNGQTDNPAVRLFRSLKDDKLASSSIVPINVVEYGVPVKFDSVKESFQYTHGTRNGFFKLSLEEPEGAFGHVIYNNILSRTMTENARLKKPKELPNLPYTPIVNKILLNYRSCKKTSCETISDKINGDKYYDDAHDEKIFQLHPFGYEVTYPLKEKPCYLMPQYTYEGNLFIGISSKALAGILTLYFDLSKEVVQSGNTAQSRKNVMSVDWFYLSSNSWIRLSDRRLLSDSTLGFTVSGIVTLDIPVDINTGNSVMPAEYYWLRVSTNNDIDSYNNIFTISTNALSVTRKLDDRNQKSSSTGSLAKAKPNKWSSIKTVPGLGKIIQAGTSFDGKQAESDRAARTRISERIRHKNRAVTPWDYERIILEHFPDIYKVKCFPSFRKKASSNMPGQVLIVAMPHVERNSDEECKTAILSSIDLIRIKSYIEKYCSPFVTPKVINPAYDQIQVRCTVRLVEGTSDGVYINLLNKAISNYLCPWTTTGIASRFGWEIRQKDFESYIRNLDYIDFVTDFSILCISVDGKGKFHLYDTAAELAKGMGIETNTVTSTSSNINERSSRKNFKNSSINTGFIVKPHYPWSLPIPAIKHFIKTTKESRVKNAEKTGINELEIGNNFIINGNS